MQFPSKIVSNLFIVQTKHTLFTDVPLCPTLQNSNYPSMNVSVNFALLISKSPLMADLSLHVSFWSVSPARSTVHSVVLWLSVKLWRAGSSHLKLHKGHTLVITTRLRLLWRCKTFNQWEETLQRQTHPSCLMFKTSFIHEKLERDVLSRGFH